MVSAAPRPPPSIPAFLRGSSQGSVAQGPAGGGAGWASAPLQSRGRPPAPPCFPLCPPSACARKQRPGRGNAPGYALVPRGKRLRPYGFPLNRAANQARAVGLPGGERRPSQPLSERSRKRLCCRFGQCAVFAKSNSSGEKRT